MSDDKGKDMKDIGKTATGVALGVLSVPVIIAIVSIIGLIALCVLCNVMGSLLSALYG